MTEIDGSVPQSARIWNYWLGGKDNYPADREAGERFRAVFPGIVDIARASRAFLTRAVRHLAADAGLRQFLDIGTGLPTLDNTHQVAQRVAPDARIVYVDNDPLVLVHARALLTSTPEGATAYIDADLRTPGTILDQAAETLDLDRPIAIIMSGILGHIADDAEARSIVRRLIDGVASGSHLVVADGANAVRENVEAQRGYNEGGPAPYHLRGPDQFAAFFDGLDLLDPGLVSVPRWRPDPTPFGEPPDVDALCAVARKP